MHNWVPTYEFEITIDVFRILGEESTTNITLTDNPTWIIDPIDGTMNYIRGLPIFGVSVALSVNREIVMGAVFNPAHNEFYTARKEHGAYLNGRRIQCKETTTVIHHPEFPRMQSFILILFTKTENYFQIQSSIYSAEILLYSPVAREKTLKRLVKFGSEVSGYMQPRAKTHYGNHDPISILISVVHRIRSLGSAALSLCNVAAGIIDIYIADYLKPWDLAAGALIVTEAGGTISLVNGEPYDPVYGNIIACSTEQLSQRVLEYEKSIL